MFQPIKTEFMIFRSIAFAATMITAGIATASPVDTVVDSLLNTDPVLRARAAEYAAEWHESKAENTLDDPEVSFDHFWSSPSVGHKMNIGVSQSFDWPGLYGRRSRLADATRDAGAASLAVDRADRIAELLSVLTTIAYTRDALRQAEIADSLSHELLEATTEAESHGLVTKVDLGMVSLEHLSVHRALSEAHIAYEQALMNFETITGGCSLPEAVINSLELSAPEELQSLDTYLTAATAAPSVAARQARIQQAMANARVVSAERMPGFSLGYTYNREFGDNFHGITAGITLPVYSRRSRTAAASERILALEADDQAATRAIEPEIRSLHSIATRLCADLAEYDRQLDNNNLAALLHQQYDSGAITRMDYLRQLSIASTLQADRLATRYAYAETLIKLRTVTGLVR